MLPILPMTLDENPYEAPAAPTNPELSRRGRVRGLRPAQKGRRFTNWFVDMLVRMGVVELVGLAVGWLGTHGKFSEEFLKSTAFAWLDFALGLLVGFIYYFVFEVTTGRTLGKYLTGTQVVDTLGNKPTTKAIVVRTLCRSIPFEILSFLASDSGWHDSFSGTKVVHVRDLERVRNSQQAQTSV